jgi:hypothetical protein
MGRSTVTGAAVVVVTTRKDEERNQAEAEQPRASREVHATANVVAPCDRVEWGGMSRRYLPEPVPASRTLSRPNPDFLPRPEARRAFAPLARASSCGRG